MERRIDCVDVSSCMLFESIGDSEADSDVNSNDNIGGLPSSSHGYTDLAEDDAFSCCSENHEYYNDVDHPTGGDPHHHHHVYVDEDQLKEEVELEEQTGDSLHEYDEEEEDEEEDDAVVQVLNYVKDAGPRTNKLKVRGGDELLNEKDMDRHFWETCLAS